MSIIRVMPEDAEEDEPEDPEKPCEECASDIGTSMAFSVCDALKEKGKQVDCERLEKDFESGEKSGAEIFEELRKVADGDPEINKELDEILEFMGVKEEEKAEEGKKDVGPKSDNSGT